MHCFCRSVNFNWIKYVYWVMNSNNKIGVIIVKKLVHSTAMLQLSSLYVVLCGIQDTRLQSHCKNGKRQMQNVLVI